MVTVTVTFFFSRGIRVCKSYKSSEKNFLFADMKEEEIEVNDMKGENSDMGAADQDEESSFLENGVEENPGKDVIRDQDMPMWRLPRYLLSGHRMYPYPYASIVLARLSYRYVKGGELADLSFVFWELI